MFNNIRNVVLLAKMGKFRFKSLLKEKYLAVLISIFTYLLFFYPILQPDYAFWTSDIRIFYYPSREYFHEQVLQEKRFPFWTEKQYSGFPLYADLENAYLNIPNVLSILLFGPFISYKILHFLTYFAGSMALYYFLKRKGIGLLPFAAANVIFFFSHFFINRQIHYGIVMAMYLFPLLPLLFDLYLEKRQLKYVVFAALAFSGIFYWGHLQITLIAFIGFFLYILVYSIRNLKIKPFILYNLILGFLIVAFTIPQLFPTYFLAHNSIRSPGGVSVYQGSLVPNLIVLFAYPSVFGESGSPFVGSAVDSKYSYVETYSTYVGITSLLLALLGLMLTKNDRLKVFSVILLFVFFIFGFLKYMPNLDVSDTPIVSLFRYWNRTVVLAGFGIAMLAAKGLQGIKDQSFKFSLLPFGYAGLILGYWAYLFHANTETRKFIFTYEKYIKNIRGEENFKIWAQAALVVAVLILLSLVISWFLKKISNRMRLWLILQVLLVTVVFFDLRYFSTYMLDFRIKKVWPIEKTEFPEELAGKRVVNKGSHMRGMENLYYSVWSPFGYSQLADEKYSKALLATGVPDAKDPKNAYLKVPEARSPLRRVGVQAVIYKDEIFPLSPEGTIEIISGDILGNYLIKREGHIKFELSNAHSGTIKTYIRNYPGWTLKIDGKKADFIESDDLFLKFKLQPDNKLVEMKFVPIHFYQGLLIAAFMLAPGVIFYKSKFGKRFIDKNL
jgi:hypothetical protein